jgi:hypothetical protein
MAHPEGRPLVRMQLAQSDKKSGMAGSLVVNERGHDRTDARLKLSALQKIYRRR